MMETYYDILEISPTATEEEIKKAFRQKAKLWHPDINKNPDANYRFRLIYEAFEILSQHRTIYDLSLHNTEMPSADLTSTISQAQHQARKYASMSYDAFLKACLTIGKEIVTQSTQMTITAIGLICSTSGIGLIIYGLHWWETAQIIIGIILFVLPCIFPFTSNKTN